MNEISVIPEFVTNLANRMRVIENDLRAYATRGATTLLSAPEVAKAYQELGTKWDYRRNNLADLLEYLADSLIAARDQYVGLDRDLAAQVRDS